MRRSLKILFLLLVGTLLVKQVRAPAPHPETTDSDSDSEPQPVPNTNHDDNSGSSSGEGEDLGHVGGITLSGGTPAAPVAPPAEGNEAEFEEEDVDYSEILKHVSELLDAITAIISDLDSGSSTTVSAPLPTAALPCYSVSSIYNECALRKSEFPHVVFPIQASCLCYVTKGNDTTAIWAPDSYDGHMSRCNNFAQTQSQASITNSNPGTSRAEFDDYAFGYPGLDYHCTQYTYCHRHKWFSKASVCVEVPGCVHGTVAL